MTSTMRTNIRPGISCVAMIWAALLLISCGGGGSGGSGGGSGGGAGSGGSAGTAGSGTPSLNSPWATPVAIDEGTNNALHPQIGTDDAGNAVALWMENDRSDPKRYYAWSNQYTAGGGWGTPQEIEPQTSLSSGLTYSQPSPPSLAMNGTGDALAAWEQWVNISTGSSPTYLYGVWTSNYDSAGWFPYPPRPCRGTIPGWLRLSQKQR